MGEAAPSPRRKATIPSMTKARAVGQLALPMDLGWPELPRVLRPMYPRRGRPFNSPDHLFEPVWGGLRALAFVARGEARLMAAPSDAARQGGGLWTRVSDLPMELDDSLLPELSRLAGGLRGELVVLDGELVVTDGQGRADPIALRRRLLGHAGPPAVFLAFDLLYLDGRPLLADPLETRRERLEQVVGGGDVLLAVPAIIGEGTALLEAAAGRGLAGVLGRSRRSPYLPGLVSQLWRAIPAPPPGAKGGGPTRAEGRKIPRTTPVLTVLRRLPLDADDAG